MLFTVSSFLPICDVVFMVAVKTYVMQHISLAENFNRTAY